MKKQFERPELEVIRFSSEEILAATSAGGCTGDTCTVDNPECPIEGEFIPF